jgi:hypothetical protein
MARPFGNPALEAPKAQYRVFDWFCAGSPAIDAVSPRSAEDDDDFILIAPGDV